MPSACHITMYRAMDNIYEDYQHTCYITEIKPAVQVRFRVINNESPHIPENWYRF